MKFRYRAVVLATSLVLAALIVSAASASTPVRPSNDDIDNAISIPEDGSYTVTSDLNLATTSSTDPSCGAPMYQTVWYSFTATLDQQIIEISVINSQAPYMNKTLGPRPRLSAWTGSPGALTAVQCDPDADQLEFVVQAGQTYYFELGSAQPGGNKQVSIQLTSPIGAAQLQLNDLFWYATPIDSVPATFSEQMIGPTSDIYDPPLTNYSFLGTVWYVYTSPVNQQLDAVFDSVSSEPNTGQYVGVMSGTLDAPVNVLSTQLATQPLGKVRFQATAGTTYHLMYSVGQGNYEPYEATMSLQPSPPPIGGSITVGDPQIVKRRIGLSGLGGLAYNTTLTLPIHLSCDSPVPSVNVGANLIQDGIVRGWGQATVDCSSGSIDTTMNLEGSFLLGGSWQIDIDASSFDANYNASATQAVSVLPKE